jgi:hypothetical protein
MSTKGIYDAIKAALPTSLQPVFLFGARKLSEGAGPIRIVMVPAADTYGARARQGGSQPQEIYGYQGDVVFDVVAPTHEALPGELFAGLWLLGFGERRGASRARRALRSDLALWATRAQDHQRAGQRA